MIFEDDYRGFQEKIARNIIAVAGNNIKAFRAERSEAFEIFRWCEIIIVEIPKGLHWLSLLEEKSQL